MSTYYQFCALKSSLTRKGLRNAVSELSTRMNNVKDDVPYYCFRSKLRYRLLIPLAHSQDPALRIIFRIAPESTSFFVLHVLRNGAYED